MSVSDFPASANDIGLVPEAEARGRRWDLSTVLLVTGLLTLPFQVVQISIAQLGHLWMIAVLGFIILTRSMRLSSSEVVAFAIFLYATLAVTFLQDFARIKHIEQLSKFIFFYPGFYIVGRWIGHRFADRPMPLGYVFLFVFLAFQFVTQTLTLPIIHQPIDFGQGALHGTFRERNWLAVYFLMFSYLLLLNDESKWKFVSFFAINIAVTLLSGSKTTFVAAGLIFLFQSKWPLWMKIVPVIIGAIFYMSIFANDFSQDQLNVKLEEERGLAFTTSLDLIAKNPVGYGLGFVEAYFSSNSVSIKGLGAGTNSVFSVPLDLFIIAGVAGLLLWLVIFVGVGNGAMLILAPIAALSLLNPMHQSELVYFFLGMLVSKSKFRRAVGRAADRDHATPKALHL